MRLNPFHLLIPCHRVVKSGGQIGAYCGGKRNNVKQWLLDYEKRIRHRQDNKLLLYEYKPIPNNKDASVGALKH